VERCKYCGESFSENVIDKHEPFCRNETLAAEAAEEKARLEAEEKARLEEEEKKKKK
jgi:hypothetical protein